MSRKILLSESNLLSSFFSIRMRLVVTQNIIFSTNIARRKFHTFKISVKLTLFLSRSPVRVLTSPQRVLSTFLTSFFRVPNVCQVRVDAVSGNL